MPTLVRKVYFSQSYSKNVDVVVWQVVLPDDSEFNQVNDFRVLDEVHGQGPLDGVSVEQLFQAFQHLGNHFFV
jgi:hypothetical protein